MCENYVCLPSPLIYYIFIYLYIFLFDKYIYLSLSLFTCNNFSSNSLISLMFFFSSLFGFSKDFKLFKYFSFKFLILSSKISHFNNVSNSNSNLSWNCFILVQNNMS
jgi:hypothetical protein